MSDIIDCYLLIVDVEIYGNVRDLLVSPISKEDFGIGGRAQYAVSTMFYILTYNASYKIGRGLLVCLPGKWNLYSYL